LLELGARVYVSARYTDEEVTALTTVSGERGRYAEHPVLPYVLRRSHEEVNSYGWRGGAFSVARTPGVRRVIAVGASTTYGGEKPYPAILAELLDEHGIPTEVLNAGVPGWTSAESLVNFETRGVPLRPDLVIVYHGRNDLIPQCYNDFRPDHSHFRDRGYEFRSANQTLKRGFAVSRLFMLAALALPGVSGWDPIQENPVYASVRVENRPSADEVLRNLADPARTQAFRANIGGIVRLSRESGAGVILGTFAFLPEKLRTEYFLREDPAIFDALHEQLERNNAVLRELAEQPGVYLADTQRLEETPEIFFDDCHVDERGHEQRARILLDVILTNQLL